MTIDWPCGCWLETENGLYGVRALCFHIAHGCVDHAMLRHMFRRARPLRAIEERCDVAARLAGIRLQPWQREPLRRLLADHARESAMTESPPAALVQPCTCHYDWPPFPYGHGYGYPRFTINPQCYHHGEARRWVNLEVAW